MSLFSRFFGGRPPGGGDGDATPPPSGDEEEEEEIAVKHDHEEVDARFAEWNAEEGAGPTGESEPPPPVIIARVVTVERTPDRGPAQTPAEKAPSVRLPGRPDIARKAAERKAKETPSAAPPAAREPMRTLVDTPESIAARTGGEASEWELTPMIPGAGSDAVTPLVPDTIDRVPSTRSPRSGTVPPPVSAPGTSSPTTPDMPAQMGSRTGDFPAQEAGTEVSPPASAEPASAEPWSADSVDDLMADLDEGFGAILEGRKQKSVPPAPGSPAFAEARRLFGEMVSAHMRHVRDFILDLTHGPATADWLSLCLPASRSLEAGARQFELTELAAGIDAFVAALVACAASASPTVEGAYRDEILASWERMASAMPEAFKLDRERQQREGIIVKALLEQVEGVQKVQQDRLFAAGLMALDVLFTARARDIADTTGLPLELTTRIVQRFARYKDEMSQIEVDETRRGEYARLGQSLQDLTVYHETYEQASLRGQLREKKAARKHREIAVLDLKVMLARLGEAHALYAIERAPFAGKIAHVKELLVEKERQAAGKV